MTLQEQFESIKTYGYILDAKHYEDITVTRAGKTFTRRQLVGSDRDDSDKKKFDIKATKEQIENLKSMPVTSGAEKLSREELKSVYNSLKDGENQTDGRKAVFVHGTFGKLIGHGNEKIKTVIPYLTDIYNKSIPLYDSNYVSQNKRADGSEHKEHDNFKGYHNYLGKVKIDGDEYYVRFTLQETKSKKEDRNQFHDLFVSDVELYKNKATSSRNLPDNNRATDEHRGLDKILNEVLSKVNEKETTEDSLESIFEMIKGGRL